MQKLLNVPASLASTPSNAQRTPYSPSPHLFIAAQCACSKQRRRYGDCRQGEWEGKGRFECLEDANEEGQVGDGALCGWLRLGPPRVLNCVAHRVLHPRARLRRPPARVGKPPPHPDRGPVSQEVLAAGPAGSLWGGPSLQGPLDDPSVSHTHRESGQRPPAEALVAACLVTPSAAWGAKGSIGGGRLAGGRAGRGASAHQVVVRHVAAGADARIHGEAVALRQQPRPVRRLHRRAQ